MKNNVNIRVKIRVYPDKIFVCFVFFYCVPFGDIDITENVNISDSGKSPATVVEKFH